ncbi:ASCC2 family CUE domain-containing protein [Aspergillus lucknowensis]|uniref:CUE domain-containing protein n=1 Tax=Aspergillus lucknowensis TaxID=176173 RepID=A0ABR4LZ86_9EURO
MTALPPLAPLPPQEVRKSIPSEEWELYIDAWVLLLGSRLKNSESVFRDSAPKDESAILFLASFYHRLATSGGGLHQFGTKAKTLRRLCFLLTRRFLLEITTPPAGLLEWTYLGEMCCCYPSSSALKNLLSDAWDKHEEALTSSLEKGKLSIIKRLSLPDSTSTSKAVADIRLLTILTSSLPAAGHVLMAGSEFLDTLADTYQAHNRGDMRRTLVANVYVGLTSLLKVAKPKLSLLLDQLFGLKASAGIGTPKVKKEPTLLSDVICSSDLLARLERYLVTQPQKRGQDLVSSLRSYQNEWKSFHHRYQKPKKRIYKGKGRASDTPPTAELHAHRMSLITQIQDLFPDLGSGYIVRLLDFYGDNPEMIIAHLLDGSISPELQDLDKSEQLATSTTAYHDPLPPNPTPPTEPLPTRKNIFDNDVDLAELARSDQPTIALRFGRANPTLTADDILADRDNHAAKKAAIISALATFDSDDDERDDTYDVADVGGTVDATDDSTATDRKLTDELDLMLLRAYKSNAALFSRDSGTRRGQPRASLKRETGMTDEAIEGWAVMLSRDPERLAKLEDKLALSAGPGMGMPQPELASTSYRRPKASGDAESESGTDAEPAYNRGGSAWGRGRGGPGRGRGRGRGGGGASGEQNTAASRQRKEENKASRANHNRRQQRAKKVARAGGMAG